MKNKIISHKKPQLLLVHCKATSEAMLQTEKELAKNNYGNLWKQLNIHRVLPDKLELKKEERLWAVTKTFEYIENFLGKWPNTILFVSRPVNYQLKQRNNNLVTYPNIFKFCHQKRGYPNTHLIMDVPIVQELIEKLLFINPFINPSL